MPKENLTVNKRFPCFKAGRNENEADCITCKTSVSVINKGSYDLEAHLNTAKHKKQIQNCHNTRNVSNFFIKHHSKTGKRVTATEGALSFHAWNITYHADLWAAFPN
jgi:hypothetical protein